LFFCAHGAWQSVEGNFQPAVVGRGRRDKPRRPPLLELSLQVKRNNAHDQSSAFVDAPVLKASTRVIDERSALVCRHSGWSEAEAWRHADGLGDERSHN
jgi:hypothetical protein